jgi:proteasome lid subunit RPN8/RPN11
LSTPFRLQVPLRLVEEMVEHARAALPNECVGLLAGRLVELGGGRLARVEQRYPLVNAAASPREYLSDPKSMFAAMRDIWGRDMQELAIYHSHPTSAPVPSRTDLERNYSPDVVNFIVSLAGPEPHLRGWWLTDRDYREAEWDTLD